MWLGEFDAGDTIDFAFTTRRFSSGAPFALAGSPAISCYKDNSTTESTVGITLTTDFDSRTGLNHVRCTTASDGTFYANGSDFRFVITAGTVDSVSVVGEVVAHFTLRNRAPLKPATADRTLVVSAAGVADAQTILVGPSGSGTAQTARDIGASVLLSSGTGTGQLDFTSGVVKANATQFSGQTITCSGGVTIPAATLASTINITAGTITTVNGFSSGARQFLYQFDLAGYVAAFGEAAAYFQSILTQPAQALVNIGLDHLISAAVDGTDVADNSIIAKMVSKNATADWDTFVNTTEALEALRDNHPSNFSALLINGSGHISRVTLTDTLTTYTGNTVQTGDSFARLGLPAGASVSADIAAVKTDTGNLVTRITSTLFSGITSLAQWLGLMAGKQTGNSTARTEIRATGAGAGTFDETLHSEQAIRDKLDTISSGTGSGARTVTITVNDGATVLQNARVRLTSGALTFSGLTNVSGVIVFNVDDATYTVSITKPGYTFAGTTLLVDGTETVTYSMTQVVFPAASPDQVTGYLYVYDEEGDPELDVAIVLKQIGVAESSGAAYDGATRTEDSDVDGLVQFTGLFIGGKYEINRGGLSSNAKTFTIPADADDPFPLASVIDTVT